MMMLMRILTIMTILIIIISSINFFSSNSYSNKSNGHDCEIQNYINLKETNINNSLLKFPLVFSKNNGQINNNSIKFYIQNTGICFTNSGMLIELKDSMENEGIKLHNQRFEKSLDLYDKQKQNKFLKQQRIIIKQEILNARIIQPIGKNQLEWNSNFFYGNDSSKWCTGVPNYAEIYYQNIYNGIDLRYYFSNNGLKYDFIVHPGADYKQIKIKYQGAEKLLINNKGDLIIKNKIKDIIDSDLFIYQNRNKPLESKFQLWNESEYGFTILGDYNKKEKLIIDPHLVMKSSTMIGGINWDSGFDIRIDKSGNIYLTGTTSSANFPITPDGINTSYNGGLYDIIISKFNNNLTKLLYSTFIGGSGYEYGINLELDNNNNICLSGDTSSQDFPITLNAYDDSYNEQPPSTGPDLFALKLNQSGSKLLFSTYIGGNYGDYCSSLVLDKSNNFIISGTTNSTNFPTTLNAYDLSFNGYQDAFFLRLNHNGTNVTYSTYLGGSNYDGISDILLDKSENLCMTGMTTSIEFPITSNAFDNTYNGGPWSDAFFIEFDMKSSTLNYSTFIGGNKTDIGEKINIDQSGSIVIIGETDSSDFPMTTGVYDSSYNGGSIDAFILKLNHSKLNLNFSTFLGGNKLDRALGIALDSMNNFIVAGYSNSNDFPVTDDAMKNYNVGVDGFIAKLSNDGSKVIYSSFIGGSNSDIFYNIVADLNGNLYLTGETNSTDFKTTEGVFNRFRQDA